jgi:hypothetical protein
LGAPRKRDGVEAISARFATVHARPEELPEETLIESAPPIAIEAHLGGGKTTYYPMSLKIAAPFS